MSAEPELCGAQIWYMEITNDLAIGVGEVMRVGGYGGGVTKAVVDMASSKVGCKVTKRRH